MKPLLWSSEISYIEKLLLASAARSGRVDVLEWGSGGSTVYFTRFLRNHSIPYSWTSLEYNARWARDVERELAGDSDTTVVLIDVGNDRVLQRYTEMEEYIAYPRTTGKKFDFVFIDGRKRRRCLLEALHLLNENGVALLHDAERRYYWSAFKSFPRGHFPQPRLFFAVQGTATLFEHVRHYLSFFLPIVYRWKVVLWRLKQWLLRESI
jgi:predicted O-methyltransferase YrrM